MKTLIHISDLHFGKTDNNIVINLAKTIAELRPHVLVVSGDLTQRARETEFVQARNFLNAFPCPKVVVPGNHDIPLYNMWARFYRPHAQFTSFIAPTLEPAYLDEDLSIIGINTARPYTWKQGSLNKEQVAQATRLLSNQPPSSVKIIVTHHPFKHMGKRPELEELVRAGAGVFLSGHLHSSRSEHLEHIHNQKNHSALVIQAGTATSTRYRGEPNAFNHIIISGNTITIEQYHWQTSKFSKLYTHRYAKTAAGWQPAFL
jgi:3',5'-cyclic AMP phosphodiesterase CpdA